MKQWPEFGLLNIRLANTLLCRKKQDGASNIERFLVPGFNHTRSLTTLFCYLLMKH